MVQTNEQPCVSIVMPAYNAQATIDDALASLACQDLPDFELIVVDDGSTDETAAIVRRWCARDARMRLMAQSHASAGAARNQGMREAQGQYLLFLDADDVFESSLLSYLYAAATETAADVVICNADCFAIDPAHPAKRWDMGRNELAMGVYEAAELHARLYQCTSPMVWNKLFRTDAVRAAGVRFQNQPRFNDAYFTIMMLAHARTICKINNVLVHYRVEAGESLVDQEAHEPLCDLAAFDAARTQLQVEGLLTGLLKQSFDNLCVNTITWRLSHFARKSEFATRELFNAYFNDYAYRWGLADATWPYVTSVRYALEYRLMKKAGVQGLLQASAPDTRTRASKRDVPAELQFVARLISAAYPFHLR